MSDIKRNLSSRRSSNSSVSSRTSNVSFSGEVRRESTAKFDNFMKECRAAYLAVLTSTKEKITSSEELALALQFGGRNPSQKGLKKYWKDNTDSISYNEFCDIMRKEKPASKDSLLKCFKKFDINGDGFISHTELFNMLTTRGERMTKSDVQTILDEADDNGDGKLDYREFCSMIISTAEDCKQKSLYKLTLADNQDSSSKGSTSSLRGGVGEANASISRQKSKLQEPVGVRNWSNVSSKGSFFVDQDGKISSHHFQLTVPKDTQLWLTIQSTASTTASQRLRHLDMAVFIINERSELVAFTETQLGMKFCVQCHLKRGTYDLLTFSSGCHLTGQTPLSRSPREVKLVTGTGDDMRLTRQFRETLTEMFNHCDLDGNGFMSRKEFDFFQMRSSGEPCDDDAWDVMIENFEMNDNQEIVLKGFLDLNLMEAKDADGDPNDLWVTLESMGYNRALELDRACPFLLEIFVKNCKAKMEVTSVDNGKTALENAVLQSVFTSYVKKDNVRGMKDLIMYKYENETRVTLAVENQSHSSVLLRVDCDKSRNCVSHRGDLDYTLETEPGKTEIAHHIVAEDPRRDWSVRYALAIEK